LFTGSISTGLGWVRIGMVMGRCSGAQPVTSKRATVAGMILFMAVLLG
jgi:hypothetical protein